tara:strand:- start:318 stop:593 length:276 start_codon:yes stop_codon:yes gene_type:complete
MTTEDRIKAILSATPQVLSAVDYLLLNGKTPDEKPSFKLYRMGEACDALGMSRTTLWRAIQEGRISTVKIAGKSKPSHRIAENELKRFAGA